MTYIRVTSWDGKIYCSNAELLCCFSCEPGQVLEETIELPLIWCALRFTCSHCNIFPDTDWFLPRQLFHDSRVHGAYTRATWARQDPGGPHVGPMIFAIWELAIWWHTEYKLPVICTNVDATEQLMRKSKDNVYGIWVYKVLGMWKGDYRVKKITSFMHETVNRGKKW